MMSNFSMRMISWLKSKMGGAQCSESAVAICHEREISMNSYAFPCGLDKSFAFHSLKDVEQLVKYERNSSVLHKVTSRVKVEKRYLTVRSTDEQKPIEPSSSEDSFGKPAWMLETPSPIVFDPDCISEFRKALDELCPEDSVGDDVKDYVEDYVEEHHNHSVDSAESGRQNSVIGAPPGGENKVILYVTSLRGIRKTFEECNTVKVILRASRVHVDERDISMDSEFKKEFEELFAKRMMVPRLFVRGKYIGGVEEIQQLNEVGELAKQFEGISRHASFTVCEGCADVRFIPCNNCSGSRKIFSEDCGWLRCPECNENGLLRCPFCIV